MVKRKPIPKLGDMNTPLDKVKRFYQFWFNFDSWRDYSVEGEYNLDEASCRYEKRQMLKENKKLKASQIKEEKARISKLANLAYKHDPRIIVEEERIQNEREKIKQERLIQKQREKEEEEEKKKQMKKQYEENLKKQQEMLVKQREEMINSLIELATTLGMKLDDHNVFQISLNGKIDNIKQILAEIEKENTTVDKKRVYRNMTYTVLGCKFNTVESASENMIWKKEEISNLQKAVKKFPAGTKDRWEKMGEIIKTKSTNQIIQMTHFLTTHPSIKIESDIDLNKVFNKSKKEETKPKEETPSTTIPSEAQGEESWSEEQQKALEGALKKFPSSLSANERWTSISTEVPGKNKKQCVDRYKYLSSLVKKK